MMSLHTAKSGERGAKVALGLVGQTFAKMRSGTMSPATSGGPLAADTPCFRVILQADPDNGGDDVMVGGRDGCHYQLEAGDSVELLINNLNKIYVLAASGSPVVNWIVFS